MLKAIVMIVSGVIGFAVAFSFTASDEIGAEVSERLENDFVNQCAARGDFPAPAKPYARDICGCMKKSFDREGLKLTDAFGEDRAKMQKLTQDCVNWYL